MCRLMAQHAPQPLSAKTLKTSCVPDHTSIHWCGSAEVLQYLDGELLLLAPETSPYIGLHLAWGCLPQQPHQQGVAGCPSQVLAELCKYVCQVIVDAHHMLLTCCCLSEI